MKSTNRNCSRQNLAKASSQDNNDEEYVVLSKKPQGVSGQVFPKKFVHYELYEDPTDGTSRNPVQIPTH